MFADGCHHLSLRKKSSFLKQVKKRSSGFKTRMINDHKTTCKRLMKVVNLGVSRGVAPGIIYSCAVRNCCMTVAINKPREFKPVHSVGVRAKSGLHFPSKGTSGPQLFLTNYRLQCNHELSAEPYMAHYSLL